MKQLNPVEWHRRFQQQALWTAQLRSFIFRQLHLESSPTLMEIGSGTGAVLSNFAGSNLSFRVGVDIRFDFLSFAQSNPSSILQTNANGLHLPFPEASFSTSFCHFLLLWVSNPLAILKEMKRVTRPGGVIIALAEPDYGGRIDHPLELVQLGQQQAESLRKQGADPYIGRRLHGLFCQAGLLNVQSGILGGYWGDPPSIETWESEWATLEQDLANSIDPAELHRLRELDAAAWEKGERILFVPTFYAWGFTPDQ